MPVRLHPLSNVEITNYFEGTPQWGGCVSRDQLLAIFRPGKCYVINIAPSTWPEGTHWCAASCLDGHTLVYFDSYGQPPPADVRVLQCAKKYELRLLYNRHDEQGLDQISCGYYSCAVIRWLLAGVPFTTICTQKLHPGNFVQNQRVVVAEAPVP